MQSKLVVFLALCFTATCQVAADNSTDTTVNTPTGKPTGKPTGNPTVTTPSEKAVLEQQGSDLKRGCDNTTANNTCATEEDAFNQENDVVAKCNKLKTFSVCMENNCDRTKVGLQATITAIKGRQCNNAYSIQVSGLILLLAVLLKLL